MPETSELPTGVESIGDFLDEEINDALLNLIDLPTIVNLNRMLSILFLYDLSWRRVCQHLDLSARKKLSSGKVKVKCKRR